ncbi:hypothetical protein H4CHR_02111 [Variovorax sp. PBS-H4]|uniref:hypothetical protein n=1 Tax=Variovorax sp. PBS-H4 TaxID=434008 RepID=UPI00131600DF|nr:hypothetical protein [Variovorax sp. PBS-H4]VTU27991.1 hypothetical protein H4CHR_02111 [Variovorax sp. PBS-H4]
MRAARYTGGLWVGKFIKTSARIAFMREGGQAFQREQLRAATVLEADEASIPAEIRSYLRCNEGAVMFGGEG